MTSSECRQRCQAALCCRGGAGVPFMPSIYEHKAWFIRETPSRVARDAELFYRAIMTEYEQIKPDFSTTSLATVYKTVNLLKEMGEVLELGFADGSNRHDGHRPYPHPHLICTEYGRIQDLDAPALSRAIEELHLAPSSYCLSPGRQPRRGIRGPHGYRSPGRLQRC